VLQLIQSYQTGSGGTPCKVPDIFGPGLIDCKRVPLSCKGVKGCEYWSPNVALSSDEVAEEANDANANDAIVLKSYTFR
jgi:hypothetical protein